MILVHDYLIQMGGAERVVATMAKAFPSAPIFTSATDYARLSVDFPRDHIHNTWMQHLPGILPHFKKYFPIYPFAFASLALPPADAAWISSSTFAKYARPAPGTTTFCYCHSPTRFLWDTDRYVNAEIENKITKKAAGLLLPWLRRLDWQAAQRMDYFIANSENTRLKILRHYQRESVVIHPPVNIHRFQIEKEDKGHYLIVSRLIGYKNIELAIQAFQSLPSESLHIIGEGTDQDRLQKMAGPNVHFLGRLSEEALRRELEECRALIFPGEEDFGIAPVEAMACGKPVIAYAMGGALETIIEGQTGTLFHKATAESLHEAIITSMKIPWDHETIRLHAENFSEPTFLKKMTLFMEEHPNRLEVT